MRARYASRVFIVAGIFNIAFGSLAFLAPRLTTRLLGIDRPDNPLFMDLAVWMVIVLGIGYCLVGLSPERNRDLMLVGALGKILVLPLMLSAWGRGDVGLPGVTTGVVDFVFALLFFDVMRRTRAPSEHPAS
ncbi:MAG TPA: hypothetical protein VEI94_05855 [Candidatus Bathyarchaeia archaeon]|nr:hypothetical protein [Candidatus Bathyarchaeia archaeon]